MFQACRIPIWDNEQASIGFKLTAMKLNWGRLGFDVGSEAVQGIPRASDLVNTTGNAINANDERYALAA